MASKLYPDVYTERSESAHVGIAAAPPAAYGTLGTSSNLATNNPHQPYAIVQPYSQPQPAGQVQYQAGAVYPAAMAPQQVVVPAVYAPVTSSVNACLAPFYFRTYALIFYFLIVSFAWSWLYSSWVIGSFAGGMGAVAACGVGLPLLAWFAGVWRFMAHADVALTKVFCPPPDLTETVIMLPVRVGCSGGFFKWMKTSLLNSLTWRSVLYALFWRPLWGSFTFTVVLTLLTVSLALLAKPFLGAAQLDPFEHCKQCSWFLQSNGAYVIMVVLGVVVFYLLCVVVHGLALVERSMSWWALGERTVSALDYASLTVVPCAASSANKMEQGLGGGMAISKLVDPSDAQKTATFAPFTVPATPIIPYARRDRPRCLRTCCFCLCCLFCCGMFLVLAAAGLLAARCASADRESQVVEFTFNVTAGVTELLVDASGIGWGADVAFDGVGNSTDQIVVKGTVKYIPAPHGEASPDFSKRFTTYTADGSLILSAPGLSLWDTVRNCPTLSLSVYLPTALANRPRLTLTTSGGSVTVNAVDPSALALLSALRLRTSNAAVKFAADFSGPTTAVEARTTNARITGTALTAYSVDLQSTNGRIQFDRMSATQIMLVTTNSDVDVDEVRPFSNATSLSVTARSSNGDVEIDNVFLPAAAAANIDLSSTNADAEASVHGLQGSFAVVASNGEAELDDLSMGGNGWVRYTTNSRSEKRGTAGTGTGHSVSVRTTNADADLTLYP